MNLQRPNSVLLVRVPGALCGLNICDVIEIMRPLPTEPLANTPGFILGIAMIRGAAVPVVRLGALFEAHGGGSPTRFVTIRVGERRVALAVEGVIGVANLGEHRFEEMAPLLKNARTDVIQAIGTLDAELLVLLRASRLVPESVWNTFERSAAAARQ
ncbi:MAG: chemotaxis protein CheW [Candidatus Korobacteraceae bacterium]